MVQIQAKKKQTIVCLQVPSCVRTTYLYIKTTVDILDPIRFLMGLKGEFFEIISFFFY